MSALGAMLTVDLASPEQVAARHNRITARRVEAAAKEDRISSALYTLRMDCTTETTVIRALHAISAGLMSTKPLASTDILETVGWIDALADQIQYRNAS